MQSVLRGISVYSKVRNKCIHWLKKHEGTHQLIVIWPPRFPSSFLHTLSHPLSSSCPPSVPLLPRSAAASGTLHSFALLSPSALSASVFTRQTLVQRRSIRAHACVLWVPGLLKTLSNRVQKCASWAAWKYVCVSVCGASFVREKHVCGVRDGMRMHGGQVL